MKPLFASLLLVLAPPLSADPCMLAPDQRAWIESALEIWDRVRERELMLPPAPLPHLVFFDSRCVWESSSIEDLTGRRHSGTIAIPGGGEAPARLMTFAGRSDGEGPFLVMALAPLWREIERYRDDPELKTLMRSVFVHEMTHTRQADSFGQRLEAIESAGVLRDELDDDIVQRKFEANDSYRASYEQERNALFAIAEEPSSAGRSAMALAVLRGAKQRRQEFFQGTTSVYGELEEIFLAMEGVANWAGFRAAMLEGVSRERAIELMRGSRRPWTQEEGLALFLAVDALMPGWQKRAFSKDPDGAWELLAAALGGGLGLRMQETREPVTGTKVPFAVVYPAVDAAADATTRVGPYAVQAQMDARVADGKHPVVLLSHGSGGGMFGHIDLAEALARNGYIVAMPEHTGDSYRDQSGWATDRVLLGRAWQASAVISAVLDDPRLAPRVDAERIGAAGFSAGGYTALLLLGARPDLTGFSFERFCDEYPGTPEICDRTPPERRITIEDPPTTIDARVRAAFAMAPLSLLFDRESFEDVREPVFLYAASEDPILIPDENARRIRPLLPNLVEYREVDGAGHYVFLAPCPPELAEDLPAICTDPPGIDRAAVHRRILDDAIEFFAEHL